MIIAKENYPDFEDKEGMTHQADDIFKKTLARSEPESVSNLTDLRTGFWRSYYFESSVAI
jgi:hypothetical protein